jgi:hypothetical protein
MWPLRLFQAKNGVSTTFMSQNTGNVEKRAWPENCFSDRFFPPKFIFDRLTLIDVNDITNLVDPANCTDFWPGTGL